MFISCFIVLRLLREVLIDQFRLQIGMVGTFNLHWCFSSTMLGKGTPNCHKLMDYIYKWLCYVCFCWIKITRQHWLTLSWLVKLFVASIAYWLMNGWRSASYCIGVGCPPPTNKQKKKKQSAPENLTGNMRHFTSPSGSSFAQWYVYWTNWWFSRFILIICEPVFCFTMCQNYRNGSGMCQTLSSCALSGSLCVCMCRFRSPGGPK